MKALKSFLVFSALVLALFLTINTNALCQCEPDTSGNHCTAWSGDSTIVYNWGQRYPNCYTTFTYRAMVCDSTVYYEFIKMEFTECSDCLDLQKALLPGVPDSGLITNIPYGEIPQHYWRSAFYEICRNKAIADSADGKYRFPNRRKFITISPGGCNSVKVAHLPPDTLQPPPPLPPVVVPGKFVAKTIPCELEGCCYTLLWMTWQSYGIDIYCFIDDQYIIDPDCENKLPLFNPFPLPEYGLPWQISPASPCSPSCYIQQ